MEKKEGKGSLAIRIAEGAGHHKIGKITIVIKLLDCDTNLMYKLYSLIILTGLMFLWILTLSNLPERCFV